MIKDMEILEEILRVKAPSFHVGLHAVDEVLGHLRPGIYSVIGERPYAVQLLLQCLQTNDDVCLYYGYVNAPLTALYRLSALGLRIPLAQLLVDARMALTRNQLFSAFRLRMRFMQFIDIYETLPISSLSVDRLLADVKRVREKDDQLVVVCLDDFDAWLRTSQHALHGEEADPLRLVHSLRDFCTVHGVIVLTACRPGTPAAALLPVVSSATAEIQSQQVNSENDHGVRATSLIVSDAINEAPLEFDYSTELECFLDRTTV